MSFDPVSYLLGKQAGGGAVPVNKPEFELIGTKTMALEEYTDTSTAQEIDTEINIKDTDWAWGLVIITCDSAITTSTEWGMTISTFGRHVNGNVVGETSPLQQKGVSTLSYAAVAVNMTVVASGVTVRSGTSTIVIRRQASTVFSKIRAGNYTVSVYGLKSL